MIKKIFTLLCLCTLCIGSAWGGSSFEINTSNFTRPTGSGSGYSAYDGTRAIDNINITSSNVMVQSSALQFKTNSGYLYNATAMPGKITKITLATTTNLTIKVGTTENPSSGTEVTSGTAISGEYKYFYIEGGSNTPKTATITIEYEESTAPSINAANVNIDADATSGEFAYTITNPVDGKTLKAISETAWISNIQVDAKKVTFSTEVNNSSEERVGKITLTYDGAESKDITIIQNKRIPTHAVKFFVNGVQLGVTQNIKEGASVEFPTKPENIGTKVFVGWSASTIEGATNTAPTFVTSATMGTADLNFYAVFAAKQEGDGNYEKVTTAPADWCGIYLIVYETENVAFDGSLATLDAVSNTKAVTISNNVIASSADMDAIAFTVAYKTGSSTVYSLKSASGKYISGTTTTAKASNGLKQADSDADYEISFNGTTIESKSSDKQMQLKYNDTSNQSRFRFYSSGQKDIALYKKQEATYSNYCTFTPVEVTITDAKYATLGLPYAVTIPEGVSAYTATVEGTTVTMTKINKEGGSNVIPANCGVILYADVNEATTYTFYGTTTEESYPDNKLVAALEDYTCPEADKDLVYYLGKDGDNAVFKKLTVGGTIAAGKAYLKLDAALEAGAKLDVTFDEPTGITSYENDNENENLKSMTVYNLNGMKVNEAYKGIVIMNGKKYINK